MESVSQLSFLSFLAIFRFLGHIYILVHYCDCAASQIQNSQYFSLIGLKSKRNVFYLFIFYICILAKCGFGNEAEPGAYFLRVNLGETLRIRTESADWFYVSKTEAEDQDGIIPKSYVHIQDSNVLHQGYVSCIGVNN